MRFAHSLLLSLLALPLTVWAQTVAPPALTEAEAVRLALIRADWLELGQGTIQAAEADVLAAGQRPNPTLSYSRDQLNGAADSVEQALMLSQEFDLSGRRALRRDAAQRRVQAVSSENDRRRMERAGEVRRSFADTLYAESVIRATEHWVVQFRRVEGLVEKQVRAGEASGFDRRRLARERQGAQARLAEERARLAATRAKLLALIGETREMPVSGELVPPVLPPLDAALAGLDQRPDLRALAQHAEAVDIEGRAARKGLIPDLTVGFGPKWSDSAGIRANGLAVQVSIPLPVFDRQQADQKRALAEASRLRAERRLARTRATAEIAGLHRQAEALRQAALDYRAGAVAASPDLVRVAEAAYRGGESGLLELLDAYRGALDAEMTALELELRAREARIEYDLMTGSQP
jgi:cobalt-zinc-cadmium efflux system outer membrane protein